MKLSDALTRQIPEGYAKRDLAGQVCKNVYGFDCENEKTSVCMEKIENALGLKGKIGLGDGAGRGISEYLFFNCSLD